MCAPAIAMGPITTPTVVIARMASRCSGTVIGIPIRHIGSFGAGANSGSVAAGAKHACANISAAESNGVTRPAARDPVRPVAFLLPLFSGEATRVFAGRFLPAMYRTKVNSEQVKQPPDGMVDQFIQS